LLCSKTAALICRQSLSVSLIQNQEVHLSLQD
jgi:hypothetical protein